MKKINVSAVFCFVVVRMCILQMTHTAMEIFKSRFELFVIVTVAWVLQPKSQQQTQGLARRFRLVKRLLYNHEDLSWIPKPTSKDFVPQHTLGTSALMKWRETFARLISLIRESQASVKTCFIKQAERRWMTNT